MNPLDFLLFKVGAGWILDKPAETVVLKDVLVKREVVAELPYFKYRTNHVTFVFDSAGEWRRNPQLRITVNDTPVSLADANRPLREIAEPFPGMIGSFWIVRTKGDKRYGVIAYDE